MKAMSLVDWRRFFWPWPSAGPRGYVADPDALLRGNKLHLLEDGREAYPAMLEAISKARHSVLLETYILRDDRTGRKFQEALIERARAGVPVRLIFDAIGSLYLPNSFIQHLRNAGVQILEYHPVAPWRPRWAWGRRNHRKILVVDGKTAFTGGLNIADEYSPREDGGAGWRDFHVRVEGPAAYELERLFRAVWFKHTRRWFTTSGDPRSRVGHSLVNVAANQDLIHRHRIRKDLIRAIEQARRSIRIAIAYFIPDRGIRRALYQAAERDVKVDILVPEVSDVPAVRHASRYLYEKHLRKGLRLYAWPEGVLHAKAVVVDRIWSSVGSYNITHRSLMHNLEVNVHVLGRDFAVELDDAIAKDIAQSREICLDPWLDRPYRERVLERLFWLLRYWF